MGEKLDRIPDAKLKIPLAAVVMTSSGCPDAVNAAILFCAILISSLTNVVQMYLIAALQNMQTSAALFFHTVNATNAHSHKAVELEVSQALQRGNKAPRAYTFASLAPAQLSSRDGPASNWRGQPARSRCPISLLLLF